MRSSHDHSIIVVSMVSSEVLDQYFTLRTADGKESQLFLCFAYTLLLLSWIGYELWHAEEVGGERGGEGRVCLLPSMDDVRDFVISRHEAFVYSVTMQIIFDLTIAVFCKSFFAHRTLHAS